MTEDVTITFDNGAVLTGSRAQFFPDEIRLPSAVLSMNANSYIMNDVAVFPRANRLTFPVSSGDRREILLRRINGVAGSPAVISLDRAPISPSPVGCDMGVGCEEAGVCYAQANDQPERCSRSRVTEAMIDRALSARVLGGADVRAWLPMADAWTSPPVAREVMRAALAAVLDS